MIKKLLNKIKPHYRVLWAAFSFRIKIVRLEDAFGRSYRYVWKKYGHKEMVDEYLTDNTWRLKK